MNKETSIRKNYFYNLLYQVLTIIIPFITTPYVSRVLGPENVGRVSFAESIVSYFVLFATLGITLFGQREISIVRENPAERTRLFLEIKILQIFSSIISLLSYLIYCKYCSDFVLYLILCINILAVVFDVTWYFQGLEEFGKMVIRNSIVKLIGVIYIFAFVKTKNDIYKYAFGLSFFVFVSNIVLWFFLRRYVDLRQIRKIGKIRPLRHFKQVILLFIPTVAISVYTVLDKTMIGLITNNPSENGYYEQAMKISKLTLMIVTALGTVVTPRIAYYYNNGDQEAAKSILYRSYRFIWFLGMPLCFGLIGISNSFVPWFFGNEYIPVINLLHILPFLIVIIGVSNVTGMQYLIPTKRQNIFTCAVIIGAVINALLNTVLISAFQSKGAACASVTAEASISIILLYIIRKEISISRVLRYLPRYTLSSIIMYIEMFVLSNLLNSCIISSLIMTILGCITYFFILFIIEDDFFVDNIRRGISFMKRLIEQ
ncbi:MAG: oligosaccharide flippase family protein [Lachnospiraceae bacterium]|nr:oligosaccharide flippase family protein [Lachnospiraceae bacterium]